jgi:beta-lactamase superfamily II metal-dependent hydrolase
MQVLYPTDEDKHDKADDRALVARFDCEGFRVLWCNDVGFAAEKALLERWPAAELRCHVLLRNQHASDWSVLPEFLSAAQPQAVVTSNSPAIAAERLPAHLTTWCRRQGVHLFDQSVCGMVRIVIEPDELRLSAWLTDESLTLRR